MKKTCDNGEEIQDPEKQSVPAMGKQSNGKSHISLFCCAALLGTQFSVAAQNNFTGDSDVKTFLNENFDGKDCGMVIGLVDEHGARIFSAGKLDNGTDQEVNGD